MLVAALAARVVEYFRSAQVPFPVVAKPGESCLRHEGNRSGFTETCRLIVSR